VSVSAAAGAVAAGAAAVGAAVFAVADIAAAFSGVGVAVAADKEANGVCTSFWNYVPRPLVNLACFSNQCSCLQL